MSQEALEAIKDCEIIAGHSTYTAFDQRSCKSTKKWLQLVCVMKLNAVKKPLISLMKLEMLGSVSSGDGVYGMAWFDPRVIRRKRYA